MISVSEALGKVTGMFSPLPVEMVPLRNAAGRVLAKDVTAQRDQPPFAAASMDGYALRNGDLKPGATFQIIGESAAGSGLDANVAPGQTARIFTGAPVPNGADRVVMQEDVTRDNYVITIANAIDKKPNIRPSGYDFKSGDTIKPPRRLSASDIALLASINIPSVPVYRRPVIAFLATGDELVMPGETPGPDQIIASNIFGLAALMDSNGAETRILPIARDNEASLKQALKLCAGADMIVTIGGTSVGDHDIVHGVASELGLKTEFFKVAMRPGKPLMAGKLNETPMIGLPGNPVASMVCGHVYLIPAVQKMLGLGGYARSRELARLGSDMRANGRSEHYMRASLGVEYSQLTAHPFDRQDSSLQTVLSQANALLVRPPNDLPKKAGDMVEVIRL